MRRPIEPTNKTDGKNAAVKKRRGAKRASKMRPDAALEATGLVGLSSGVAFVPHPGARGSPEALANGSSMPRLLTYAEASALTGWALGTLYAMVARRQIDHVRLGPRSVRFRAEDIDRLVLEGYRAKAT